MRFIWDEKYIGLSTFARSTMTLIQYDRAGVFQHKREVLISTKSLLHSKFSHKALVSPASAVKAQWFKKYMN